MCTRPMAAQLRDLAKRCEACQYRQPATRWTRTRERVVAALTQAIEEAQAELADSPRYDVQQQKRGEIRAYQRALRML